MTKISLSNPCKISPPKLANPMKGNSTPKLVNPLKNVTLPSMITNLFKSKEKK